jgi:hypothetical protein
MLVIIVIITNNSQTVIAQTSKLDPKDNQGWFGAKLKLDLPKGWESNLDLQTRFINDFQQYNGTYITIGGAKKNY